MSESAAINNTPGTMARKKPHFWLIDIFIRLIREKRLGTVGGAIVLLLLLTGIFGSYVAPYPINESHLEDRLTGPSTKYILGTDNLGRDVLSRIIAGARVSMFVGLGASALGLSVATVIGVICGYFGGWLDISVQRFVDVALAFPMLLMIITIISVIGQGLIQVIIVMGIWVGIGWIRVIRSSVIAIKQEMYLQSARAVGGTGKGIIVRHILPNIVPIMIVIFTIDIGTNITGEATLSFLGLGVPPPAPSWGGMLSADGQRFMYKAPWLALWPGLALTIVVFGIHVFGDALRDLADPKLRGGVGRYGGAKEKKR